VEFLVMNEKQVVQVDLKVEVDDQGGANPPPDKKSTVWEDGHVVVEQAAEGSAEPEASRNHPVRTGCPEPVVKADGVGVACPYNHQEQEAVGPVAEEVEEACQEAAGEAAEASGNGTV
jgi:hypothetical protein